MKSSVHIKASDNPLYNLQDTCLESITSMTTVKDVLIGLRIQIRTSHILKPIPTFITNLHIQD